MENEKTFDAIYRKMVDGYDDFRNYYCIHKDDWNRLKKKLCEK